MSIIKDLTSIDITKAIKQMVELALPRSTRDKVLLIDVQMTKSNYDKDTSITRHIHFVIYRPSNYTYVGTYDASQSYIADAIISTKSYHDSCWIDDGVDKEIWKTAFEIGSMADEEEDTDFSIYTSFGLLGARFVDGNLVINDETRTAKFKDLEEEKK